MNKKLNIGVISCSVMAQLHMKAVIDHPNAELYMICDINEALLNETAAKYNISRKTTDYRQMLADPAVDAVIIVTPDQTHREISVAALEAGKHVLCEKPMALTLDDCKAMIAAAAKAKTKMMVGQICRYTPGFVAAKNLIERGEIGELFFVETEYAHDYAHIDVEWRLDPLRHGFLGGGCHAVDLARWIAGDPEEVFAYANHKMLPNYPTDDCTIAVMKFPNNVIGKVFVSTGCKRSYTMRSVFYGSKGTIITDNTSPYMSVFKEGLGNGDTILQDIKDYDLQTVPVQYPVNISSHNTSGELLEFLDCIVNDKPIRTTALEGAKTVIASLAAVKSSKTGMPVRPNYNI